MNILKGKQISVYGASTQCIDNDLLLKIETSLRNLKYGENYLKLFRLISGELKPFSLEEIKNRIEINDITYRINEINSELRKIGISNTISY